MPTALLDANIIISYLLVPVPGKIPTLIVEAGIAQIYRLLWVQEIGDELVNRIATKPYLSRRIGMAEIERLMALLARTATTVPAIPPENIPPVSRDPKDDYLLAYAVAAGADFLVTGDDDLLTLGRQGDVEIVSPSAFALRLGLVSDDDP